MFPIEKECNIFTYGVGCIIAARMLWMEMRYNGVLSDDVQLYFQIRSALTVVWDSIYTRAPHEDFVLSLTKLRRDKLVAIAIL